MTQRVHAWVLLVFNGFMTKNPQPDRQREHQANERTFLAWLRTSIALIGFGFAIARFGLFLREVKVALTERASAINPFFDSEKLGVSLVILGLVVIALATWRYNRVFWQIERGNYRPTRVIVLLLSVVSLLLGILSVPLILLRQEPPTTKTPRQSQVLRHSSLSKLDKF